MILDGLPYSVEIGGVEYEINTGFRTSMLFEMMMEDGGLPQTEIVTNAMQLYFPKMPTIRDADSISEVMDKVIWFYSCGSPPKKKKKRRAKQGEGDDPEDEEDELETRNADKRIYSFEYDAPFIYAAFLEQYGVDLVEIEDLHWWKFKAMFRSLNEKVQFSKIMSYRATDITAKMSAEQKSFYRRMQKVYALPLPKDEEERQDAIIDALLSGKDVSHLL